MAHWDLLRALKEELSFLDNGGYGRPFRSDWRPTLLFRDSPISVNFQSSDPLQPCSACRLFQLIPPESRSAFIPCHHIALIKSSETIATLYRQGTQLQLDTAYRQWLLKTIQEVEQREEASDENA